MEKKMEKKMENTKNMTRKEFFEKTGGHYYLPETDHNYQEAFERLKALKKFEAESLPVIETAARNALVLGSHNHDSDLVLIRKSGGVLFFEGTDLLSFKTLLKDRIEEQESIVALANSIVL